MKKQIKVLITLGILIVASLFCVSCSCSSNKDADKITAPYTSHDAFKKDPAQVEQDFKNAGFTNISIKESEIGTAGTGLEGTVSMVMINSDFSYTTSDKFSKDARVLIEVHSGSDNWKEYVNNSTTTNPSSNNEHLGDYITCFKEAVNKYINGADYPSTFNYNEYTFVKVDSSSDKVIGTAKIGIKNVPEKVDAIVIFTPGSDINQYKVNSVVVNNKVYQDDGSYASAVQQLMPWN